MSLEPGAEVGAYLIVRRLDEGDATSLWEVRHRVLDSVHALEVLRPELVERSEICGRFLELGRVRARLRHPGLVPVTDIVSEPGVAGLVMDLLDGEDLGARLQRGPLDPRQAIAWATDALAAVGYAHEQGVVHGDLRPATLFLERDASSGSRLRVLDLGRAAALDPEQAPAGGAQDADPRPDVAALGEVLYAMLTGRAPQGPPEDLEPVVPAELDVLVRRALAPGDRFASCEPLRVELEAVARRLDVDRRTPAPRGGRGVRETVSLAPRPSPLSDPTSDPASPQGTRPLPPRPSASPVRKARRHRADRVVRLVGGLQVSAAVFQLAVLALVGPLTLGGAWVAVGEQLGMPAGLVAPLVYAPLVLVPVGLLELGAGGRGLLRGGRGRRVVRLVAEAEVASLLVGGLASFAVGLVALALLGVRGGD